MNRTLFLRLYLPAAAIVLFIMLLLTQNTSSNWTSILIALIVISVVVMGINIPMLIYSNRKPSFDREFTFSVTREECLDGDFNDNDNCPVAKKLKELTGEDNIAVTTTYVYRTDMGPKDVKIGYFSPPFTSMDYDTVIYADRPFTSQFIPLKH